MLVNTLPFVVCPGSPSVPGYHGYSSAVFLCFSEDRVESR